MDDCYTMQDAARAIGIPCLGRNKLYKILKELEIVDEFNLPEDKYVAAEVLRRQIVQNEKTGNFAWTNVTLVVGKKGLCFIRDTVFEYLKENSIPNFPHRQKKSNGTSI